MPIVRRRIVALITIASLAGALPAAAHAQSAGDQQYTDPFANGKGPSATSHGHGGGGSGSSSSGSSSSGVGTLSATPQGSSGGSSAASSSTAPSASTGTGTTTAAPAAAPAATSSSALPRTGVDARLVLAVGAILVLAGLGLRLRSAPERF